MNKHFGVVLCMIVIMIGGCGHIEGYIDIVKYKGVSKGYLGSLEAWSRSQTVYSEFETMVYIKATYKGDEFNKAYLMEYARIYHLQDSERKKREEVHTSFSSDFAEFFFYAYTPEKDANDFDKERSIWTVFLVDEKGNRVNPVELRKIEKVSPLVTEFYPYVNQYYGMCYTLKFPLVKNGEPRTGGAGDKRYRLIFTSVIGKVELEWKI
jgi:hypothetical protein